MSRGVFPAVKTLAAQMFVAEFGHTGLDYDQFSDDAKGEWERRAARVLEGWWNPDKPLVVFDLAEDTMELVERERVVSGERADQ